MNTKTATERAAQIQKIKPDSIIVAWAEPAAGPGWNNYPIRFVWRDDGGRLRDEWIQPGDQTADMRLLYRLSEVAAVTMRRVVQQTFRSDPP